MRLMTIRQLLDMVDAQRPNVVPEEQKIQWLSDVDNMVYNEIYLAHIGCPVQEFRGYTADTDTATGLLVPEPYTDIYTNYVKMQIDLVTAESGKYTQDMTLFNASYKTFGDFWRRTHMPIVRRRHIKL